MVEDAEPRALGAEPKASLEGLKRRHADAVALVLPGDLPFLDPAEVRHFLRHADMRHYDYVLGLTPIESLNRVLEEAEVPGLRKAAVHTAEGRVRQNNLHLIRPFAIAHLEYFERFYEHRYQKEFWNTVSVLWEVLRASGGISRPVGYYLFAQAAMPSTACWTFSRATSATNSAFAELVSSQVPALQTASTEG